MKTPKKVLIRGQSADELGQELSALDITGVPDKEYITLLTQHTSGLLELIDKLNLNTSSFEGIVSTFSFLFGNLTEPVCVIDKDLKTIYRNACWKMKFHHLQETTNTNDLFEGINRRILRQTVHSCQKNNKLKIITLQSDTEKHCISCIPFNGVEIGNCFLLFSIGEGFLNEIRAADVPVKKEKQTGTNQKEKTIPADTFLDLIDGFYFTMDPDLKVTSISSSVQKKLGYSVSELTDEPIAQILDEKSLQNIRKAVALKIKQPDQKLVQTYRTEIEVFDHTRKKHIYDLTITYNPECNLLAGICIDIQHHKDCEQELNHARISAELNDKMKSDFLANMSHEIRTPLNGIVGFSNMLNRNHLDQAKRDRYLRIITTSTTQLLTLVSDIIDISKIEAGQLKIHFSRVEVNQIMEDLMATFVAEAQRMEKRDVKIIKQTGRPRSKFYFRSDEVRLKQVLNNLLGNALKFTQKGEIVFGYALNSPDSIRFYVRDSGTGIPKNEQKSIFKRYKQSREGMKTKYKGTGLGLAISKGIVELLGGSINVSSFTGKGSEFSFVLPLTERV